MKYTIVVTVLAFLVCNTGCRNNTENSTDTTAAADSTTFFQVTRFIKNEIDEVNKTPYYIYKLDINEDKKDSTPINVNVFNELSSTFLKPNFNDEKLKAKYKENIFEDQSTKSFTISYT